MNKYILILFLIACKENPQNKTNCRDLGGNIADGFVNECVYHEKKIQEAYMLHLKRPNIDETKYLKSEWPGKDITYKEKDVDVAYKKLEERKYGIVLFYEGGETHISLSEEKGNTTITTTYFPD